jgi:hypothetical protein
LSHPERYTKTTGKIARKKLPISMLCN